MKTFLTSLLIFSLMLFLIYANGKYLAGTADDLREILCRIPEYREIGTAARRNEVKEQLLSLKVRWHEERERISLTVSVRITEGIDDCLDRMHGALSYGDGAEFDASRAHLLRILDDLHRYEGFALGALV